MELGTIADWMLVILTAAGGTFAFQQLRIAKDSADKKVRAYLVVKLDIDNSETGRTKVYLSIQNFGSTPARNTILKFDQAFETGVKTVEHFPFLRLGGITVIPPGAEFRYFQGYVDASATLKSFREKTVRGTVVYTIEPVAARVSEPFEISLADFAGAVRIRTKK